MRWPNMSDIARGLNFLIGLIRDPFTEDASSARLLALAFGIVGIIIALQHPTEGGVVVVALVGGGAVAMMSRGKPSE